MFSVIEALAAIASFPQDTTVKFTLGDFTIAGGSGADEVTTTAASITIKISPGDELTFKSPGKNILTNDGGYSYSCSSTESSISIKVPTGDPQKTVKITPDSILCNAGGGGGSGGAGGGGGGGSAAPTATPTPIPPVPVSKGATPASRGFVNLAGLSLREGEVISAAGSDDPDVYIVNEHGYKRLFLNPVIFGFYGHLGGFAKVKKAVPATRDTLVTSGLFRNCETNDKKVYGLEATGEDVGTLHWVNTTGEQAVADDPGFFKKVFCINTKEFNWYPKGSAYTSVNQIPDYSRQNMSSSPVPVNKQYKVVGADQLNVRASASTSSAILGKLSEGQTIESLGQDGLWHKIKYQNKDGWVHSDYLRAI